MTPYPVILNKRASARADSGPRGHNLQSKRLWVLNLRRVVPARLVQDDD